MTSGVDGMARRHSVAVRLTRRGRATGGARGKVSYGTV
jgi:hypothetical protein